MSITCEELVELHPTLFHVSLASWEQIQEHGLMSTSTLLNRWGYVGQERKQYEMQARPKPVLLSQSGGNAWLNDQSPWNGSVQQRCVLPDGMELPDWFHYLNQHVFFWPTLQRLETFLAAVRAKERKRIVLEVDTRELLERVDGNVMLSSQNTGAPYGGKPTPRQRFVSLQNCPFQEWARKRKSRRKAIVEVVTASSVSLKGLFRLSAEQPSTSEFRKACPSL